MEDPKEALDAKKQLQESASQPNLNSSLTSSQTSLTRYARQEDTDSEAELEYVKEVNANMDRLRNTFLKEINSLQESFNKAILDLKKISL